MGDDRPKKSWRELDRMRDKSGSGGSRRSRDDYGRQRAQKSAAYSKYKSQLDKLFTPGSSAELPESLKAKLTPASEEDQQKRAITKALHDKPGEESLAAYLDAGMELPDNPRLLMSFLDLDDQAKLVPVLEKLLDIVEGGKRPSRMLMLAKIDALVLRLESGEAVELAQALRAALD